SYTPVNTKGLAERINSPEAYALVERLANASITALSNEHGILPIDSLSHREIAIACVGSDLDCEFVKMCENYAPITLLPTGEHGLTRTGMSRLENADIVIVGIFNSPNATANLLRQLDGKKVITVFFDSPLKMAKYQELGKEVTLVLAYDKSKPFQRAAAMALFGGIDVTGRCPVNIKGIASVGQGVNIAKNRLGYQSLPNSNLAPRLNNIVDSICSEAIKAGAMSGCQIVVAKDENIVLDKSFGRIDFGSANPTVSSSTLFDLASMTKAAATTPGIMLAVDEGIMDLNAPISLYVPELQGSDKENITISELLTHQSGMPPITNVRKIMTDTASYTPPLNARVTDATLRTDILSTRNNDEHYRPVADGIWISDNGVDTLMQAIYDSPLGKKRYNYSCLNFCLLKAAQENVTGVDLDQWVDTKIFAPLGAWHTTYLPLSLFEPEMITYTERDDIFRHQHLHGYAHDEIAAFSGGVQGNAGLFGTATDMAKLGQMLLNGGEYGGEQLIAKTTVDKFTGTITSAQRALGFDLLKRNKSLVPEDYTGRAYGHTGYTGTCFWVDPDENLVIVILTNRVNPSRDNKAFSRLNPRGAIISAIYNSLN
ncbi:MAG: beta-lactamase family protein, partial [Paramuribaculum sp.]|nr:beta-lactamase family protein [Paramuribaculum sp.]